jgi:hypothetical protein
MALTPPLEAYYEQFFVLSEGSTREAVRVRAVDELEHPEALARAEDTASQPIRFAYDEGSRLLDFMGTTWAALRLVSDRFVAALRTRGLTGWTTFPVLVRDPVGQTVPGYNGLAITGRCGEISDRLSPQLLLPPPVPGGRAATGRRGLLFEHGTWDGSDLFCAPRRTTMFATARVVDALRADGVTNVDVRRVLDIERTWNADGSLLP